MNVLKSTAVVLGLAVAPWLVPQGVTGAAASTLSAAISAAPEAASAIEQVQQRRSARREARRYERHRHGPRYRYRRPSHRYYYGGWWYASPWWIGPSITFGFGAPYYYGTPYYGSPYHGSGHVQWCLNRYRSYDPASDTFLGYDGYRHRCRSPYRP